MIVLISGWAGFRASLLPPAGAGPASEREVVRADLGFGPGCIAESAQRAAREIERAMRGRPRERVDIVAHSMGGLVASYLLASRPRSHDPLGRHARHASPRFTRRAFRARPRARTAGFASRSLRQMAPESAFLQELAGVDVPEHSRLVSIAGLDDGIVPALYAELPPGPRQFTSRIAGVGHFGLLFSREVVYAIEEWVAPCADRLPSRPLAYSPGGSAILTRRLSTHL
jgi:pimeloyl-ACP methyl ester carboxylesterase